MLYMSTGSSDWKRRRICRKKYQYPVYNLLVKNIGLIRESQGVKTNFPLLQILRHGGQTHQMLPEVLLRHLSKQAQRRRLRPQRA